MEENAIQHTARRAKQQRRVGKDAACLFCGFAEPEGLRRVPISKLNREACRIIQQHHVVGRANDPELTIPLCLNHHSLATEQLWRVGASMRPAGTLLDKLTAILKALGAFFKQLGERLIKWASELAAFVQALDVKYPAWREMPEASC